MDESIVKRLGVVYVLIIALSACQRHPVSTGSCSTDLSESKKHILTDYIRKRYALPETMDLKVKVATTATGTCYHKLSFEGKNAVRIWQLTLYASPDGRFLSPELFDTMVDPLAEQRAKDEAVMQGLLKGASATRGPERAAVTIAEFSDFQCPYCRRFAQTLDEALSGSGNDDVRVVFHHLPLTMHNWARVAAEGAGCAQIQSGEAFWSMHDVIFQNQAKLTPENIREKLGEFARNAKGLDAKSFQQCMDQGMSVGLVLRDMNMADANQVQGTPTLFINGRRIQGVENAAKLRELIEQARKESGAARGMPAA